MMIASNSLVRQKEGAQRERGGRGGRSKKGRTDRNSDARCGRTYSFNSVNGVGCEEQEKHGRWCGAHVNRAYFAQQILRCYDQ